MVLNYIKNNEIRKLHIGCGSNILDGWLNTDIKGNNRHIMFMDAGNPFPIPEQSFDYVFSEHLFEHLTYEQAKNMLSECYRILKPNGIIRIATPDIRFLIDLYLNPQKEINKSYIEFDSKRSGLPPHPIFAINRFHTAWGHKIIYDAESLIMMFENAGFKNIHQCEIGKSDYAELHGVERHNKSFERQKADKDYNALQTMVFEARR
jgi:predicted SAM-dependent methyltransferase